MKICTKEHVILFFLIYQSTLQSTELEKPAVSSKDAPQQNSGKKNTQIEPSVDVSADDINVLMNDFVAAVSLIDSKNEKTFSTHVQRAQKLLTEIKKYITEHPDKVTKEQLDTINTAVKKMPQQSQEVQKQLDEVTKMLESASGKDSSDMQADIEKAQQIITQIQTEVDKNPNLITSKDKKDALEKALKTLPHRSEELDQLLNDFKIAVQSIPEKTALNFNSAVMDAVTANTKVLNFLKNTKPLIVKDQGLLINSLVQEFKAKLPAQVLSAKKVQ